MKSNFRIYKIYSERISPLGFSRLKTAWWQRKKGLVLQMIYIHKFSFTTNFRVHATIHIAGFEEDAHWLNGVCSPDGWYEPRFLGLPLRRIRFGYTESQSSWQSSADNLYKFTEEVIIPWFKKWQDIGSLLKDSNSPLDERQKAFLAKV